MPTLPDVASATLLLNLHADTLDLADGDPVATAANAGTLAGSFTQTGSARPTYRTGGGSPYLEFDGVDDSMVAGSAINAGLDNLDSFTVFVVSVPTAGNGPIIAKLEVDADWLYAGWEVVHAFFDDPVHGAEIALFDSLAEGNLSSGSGADGATFDVSAKSVLTFEHSGMLDDHYYGNGTLIADEFGSAPSTQFSTSESVRLGVEGGENGVNDFGYHAMQLYAVMLYAPAPATSDRQAIEAWARGKHGIPIVTFQTDLVAYWLLDEASASRTDATGNGNTLTEVHGLVGSATGVNGDGALFLTADGRYLQAASTVDLVPSPTRPYTITARVKLESNTDQTLISKGDSGVYDYHLYWSAAGAFGFTYGSVTVTVPITYSASDFFFLEASVGGHIITLRVNDASGNAFETPFTGSAGALSIGGDATNDPGTPAVADAIIDDVGIWRRTLTTDERARLLAGETWPFTTDVAFFRATSDAGDITGTLAYDTASNVVASCTLDNTFGASDLTANLYKAEGDDLILWQSVLALSGASVTRTIAAGLTVGEVDGAIDPSGGNMVTQVQF